jgi:cob(I)alamin adenosyltransferase
MTNRILKLFRKGWGSLKAWEIAMDYSPADYADERIRWLEHEVKQLKDALRRPRSGAIDGGSEPSASARET